MRSHHTIESNRSRGFSGSTVPVRQVLRFRRDAVCELACAKIAVSLFNCREVIT